MDVVISSHLMPPLQGLRWWLCCARYPVIISYLNKYGLDIYQHRGWDCVMLPSVISQQRKVDLQNMGTRLNELQDAMTLLNLFFARYPHILHVFVNQFILRNNTKINGNVVVDGHAW